MLARIDPHSALVVTPADAAPAVMDHPSGYLALSPRNEFFSTPESAGFVAYRRLGRHLFCFGGVHAPERARAGLLDAFLAMGDREGRGAVGVQIRESQAALFRSRGFTVNRFGSSYGLTLAGFTLGGGQRMKLRNKIKRARAAGLTVLEVGRELPRDAQMMARLQQVGEAWLTAKRKKEIDFMVGELGTSEQLDRRIFVALSPSQEPVAFITYVPVWGERPGYLHDLTRRVPDAPPGTMELINATAVEQLAAEGARHLHFGFTPFLVEGVDGEGSSSIVSWVIRALGRYGSFVYPARSQVDYKLKWGPEIIEPEHVAFRPLSLRAVLDLLLVTRSL